MTVDGETVGTIYIDGFGGHGGPFFVNHHSTNKEENHV